MTPEEEHLVELYLKHLRARVAYHRALDTPEEDARSDAKLDAFNDLYVAELAYIAG